MKMKTTKIFGILISVLILFVSCGQIAENIGGPTAENTGRSQSVTISLPPVANANSRAIASGDIPRLQGETVKYRVIFQTQSDTVVREGTGGTFSASFTVGTEVSVTVECLNENDNVIVRTVAKTIKVGAGKNSLSFNLSEDGTEIMPPTPDPEPEPVPVPPAPEPVTGRVTYTYGEAENAGTTSGLPTDDKMYATGVAFTVLSGDNMRWTHGTFTGWQSNVAVESSGMARETTTPQAGQSYLMPDGGVVLSAQWQKNTYTITYDGNSPDPTVSVTWGNENPTLNPTEVQALGNVTIFNGTAPTIPQTGSKTYTFMGWNTEADGSGTPYDGGDTISQMTESITLYAQWSDETVYTVTFNKGTGPATDAVVDMPSNKRVEENKSATWTNPSSLGYRFDGWKVTDAGVPGGVPDLSASTTTYTPQGNTTLEGKWSAITYTINYAVKNGEGTAPSPAPTTTVTWNSTGGNYTPNNGNGFSRPGYTLTGWEFSDGTSAGTKGVATGGRKVMEKADSNNSVTVYAVWTLDTYTINYGVNSGDGSGSATQTFNITDNIMLNDGTSFTKEGHQVVSWVYSDYTSAGNVSTPVPAATLIGKADADTKTVTLTARWQPKTYNITYRMEAPNGATGTGTVDPTTREYMAEFTLATNSFVVLGYEFEGWYRNDGSSEQLVGLSGAAVNSENLIYVAEDMDLYAKWRKVKTFITIKHYVVGSVGSTPQESSSLTTSSTPAIPSEVDVGQEFSGSKSFDGFSITIEGNTYTVVNPQQGMLTPAGLIIDSNSDFSSAGGVANYSNNVDSQTYNQDVYIAFIWSM